MKNLSLVFLSLFLIFFSLSCNKDEDSIDPTEEVVLTIRFSFQYFSSDISLKKVSANLKLSEESSSVIVSNSANLNGRPNSFELVLRVSGQSAKEIIGKSAYLSTKVVYMVGNEETSTEIDATVQIHGGAQNYSLNYELVSVKSVEIIINTHFAYGGPFYLNAHDASLRFPSGYIIRDVKHNDINDTPETITTIFILEGQEALEHIGEERLLFLYVSFRTAGGTFKSYTKSYYHVIEEGVQEFDFYFAHPPDAGD